MVVTELEKCSPVRQCPLWCGCPVAQSNSILCDPMGCNCQAPLSMRFPRQAYWSGLPFPTPGDLPDQKDNKNVSHNVMNVKMGALRCEFSDWEISQVFSATRCVTGKLGGGKDSMS